MSSTPETRKPVRRALLAVYDKTGLPQFASALHDSGVELVSTGGTAAAIAAAGLPVTHVEDLTGFPECLDGRVKTLHPKVHAGLLADTRRDSHQAQLEEFGVAAFDLLAVNLYPFAHVLASGAEFDDVVEHIDVGGPSMVRGAAKNHANVTVLVDPGDYDAAVAEIAAGGFRLADRRKHAAKAFAHLAMYDSQIASWLSRETSEGLGDFVSVPLQRMHNLRYGENPHQEAALYDNPQTPDGLAQATQLHGKAMSYNNYVDADSAWRAVNDFGNPCAAIVKHANPCGMAAAATMSEAYRKALACDPVSAYGGVVAANLEVTFDMARQMSGTFTEVIVAPSYEPRALEVLRSKKNIRVLAAPKWTPKPIELRAISGGALGQRPDQLQAVGDAPDSWALAAGKPAHPELLADLAFAWWAVRAVKSNAIVLARDTATVGVGMGQVNRLDSARLAVQRAGEFAAGSAAASDAFFPFDDGVKLLAKSGVRAVVQPGGSIRDDDVVAAAADAGMTMYFTGARHFWH